jgi:hypothetical protein
MSTAVPRDDLGALAHLGRGQRLADESIEKGRFARLHPAGDRDAKGLIQSRCQFGEDGSRPRVTLVVTPSSVDERANPNGQW